MQLKYCYYRILKRVAIISRRQERNLSLNTDFYLIYVSQFKCYLVLCFYKGLIYDNH